VSIFIAIALASATAPAQSPIAEAQALDLVFKAVHQLYPRESLRCFSLVTEESSRRTFDIAVRENHKRRCGGDPGVMPVRDRFKVGRSPVSLSIYDVVSDAYRPCRLSARGARCPTN
jgi:hypothetical protein